MFSGTDDVSRDFASEGVHCRGGINGNSERLDEGTMMPFDGFDECRQLVAAFRKTPLHPGYFFRLLSPRRNRRRRKTVREGTAEFCSTDSRSAVLLPLS